MRISFKMEVSQSVNISPSRVELDTLYSPSCWSKKLSKEIIVENHTRVVTEGTERVKAQTKNTLDISYGTGSSGETFDLYYPNKDSKHDQSLLIFIHGGCWTMLGKENYGLVSLPLVRQGFTVAVINFDNAPKGTMTTIVEQCRRACVHIAQTFSNKRLFLMGHSAGAHLCACLLSTPWASLGHLPPVFHGAVLLSGMYDLGPIQRCYMNDPLNLTESEVSDYSPQRHTQLLAAAFPKGFRCHVTYGEQESPEFKRQSIEYHEALVSAGVTCSVAEVRDEDHFTLVERLCEVEFTVSKLLVDLINNSTLA